MDCEMVLGATPGVDPQVDLVLSEETLLTRPCGHGLLKDRYSPGSFGSAETPGPGVVKNPHRPRPLGPSITAADQNLKQDNLCEGRHQLLLVKCS